MKGGPKAGRGSEGVPELTAEDVTSRIELQGTGRRPDPWPPGAAVMTAVRAVAGTRPRGVGRHSDRRRVLWWDSVTIVGGVLLSLLALQLLGGSQLGPSADASPSAEPTLAAGRTLAPPGTVGPPQTLGPVVDPSLGLDATSTPIPFITLGPAPRPTPTARPGTLPLADFTWVQTGTRRIAFASTSSGDITTYLWTFGDGGSATTPNPIHVYPSHGGYVVRLTVSGPGGTDSRTRVVSVVAPTPAPSSPSPTALITPAPTLPPTDPPPPTPPPPPPSVTVSCDTATGSLTVTCSLAVSNIEPNSQVWNMGGSGTQESGGNGSNGIVFTYAEAGSYLVQVTVTGLDGVTPASDSTTVTVPGA